MRRAKGIFGACWTTLELDLNRIQGRLELTQGARVTGWCLDAVMWLDEA
jgi:hypothetical protein